MSPFSTLFATDETLCLLARQDWPEIVPDVLAEGSDGQPGGTVETRFDFMSAAAGDWVALGIAPGMVLSVTGGGGTSTGQGHFAIEAVGDGSESLTLTLRRLGQPAGIGRGPALPPNESGISYAIRSAAGAIASATGQLRSRYGLASTTGEIPAEMPADGWLPCSTTAGQPPTQDAWSRACALWAICDLYRAAHDGKVLNGSGLVSGDGDKLQAKYREYLALLKDALAALDAIRTPATAEAKVGLGMLPAAGLGCGLGSGLGDGLGCQWTGDEFGV